MLENLNPFKRGSGAEKEVPPSSVEQVEQKSSLDISVPMFHYYKKEIAALISKGMTEDEIKLKEKEVINKLARARSGGNDKLN